MKRFFVSSSSPSASTSLTPRQRVKQRHQHRNYSIISSWMKDLLITTTVDTNKAKLVSTTGQQQQQYFHKRNRIPKRTIQTSSKTSTSSGIGFLDYWNEHIKNGKLQPDKAQQRVAKRLYRLQQALIGYSNEDFFWNDNKNNMNKNNEQKVDNGNTVKVFQQNNNTNSSTSKQSNDGNISPTINNNDASKDYSKSEKELTKPPPSAAAAPSPSPQPPPPPPLPRIPRGLYIYGPVGSGKSLLMDTFFHAVDVNTNNTNTTDTASDVDDGNNQDIISNSYNNSNNNDINIKKARYHFHAFMADVHKRIHELKQDDLNKYGRNFSVDTTKEHNPIIRVALQLSQEITLLCLDEFQVIDVADAMILSQLFDVLFTHGTIIVATSNRPPQKLYDGGINRDYFLPFIDLLEKHCIVHSLESKKGDYRKVLSTLSSSSTTTTSSSFSGMIVNDNDKPSHNQHSSLFDNNNVVLPNDGKFFFSQQSTKEEHHLKLIIKKWLLQMYPDRVTLNDSVDDHDDFDNYLQSFTLDSGFGRTITVSSGDPNQLVGIFEFEELCDVNYGASDYRAIAQHFSVIALNGIPQLSTFHHNRARRFITLIDELYEGNCALICTTTITTHDDEIITDISPDNLFQGNSATTSLEEENLGEKSAIQVGETLGLEDVQTQGGQPVSTLASVRELSFAFRRAASRITEMTSRRWWIQILQKDSWIGSNV